MRLRRPLAAAAAVAATAALTLAGCSGGSSDDEGPAATGNVQSEPTDEFPVTIEHALGETVVEKAPQRVATWGWGSTEAAIAAGVYPVAVAEQVFTVGEDALLPWVEDAYDEAGVDKPAILSDPDGGSTVPYEEFVEAEPDLIVAPYSGITEEQYDVLSDIAPVVAYPDAPWTTTWQDTITLTAQALGRSAAGDKVLADIDDFVAKKADEHPEFAGKTFAAIVDDPTKGIVSVYTPADPRTTFLEGLGVKNAPAVSDLDTSKGGFYYDLSYEELDKLDSDFVVAYAYSDEAAKAFDENKDLQAIPAVKAGKVVKVVGPPEVSAVSPPTALSVYWEDGFPTLVDSMAKVLNAG
ncbi:iron-siderophore ABC transporter substrate-binding protein [Isoptericola sp. F-RaC21]|uniref:iron-siderophore ABC transporter substrate-binding protein n=1 Tax=Isoptericola sp. F-RaC21 TaxID=3141452 RepID=UPI00315BA3EA